MGEPVEITQVKLSETRYSICTFVTLRSQYDEMIESFVSHGFAYDDCEYLYIDNSEKNHYEAYAGINKFLTIAKGCIVAHFLGYTTYVVDFHLRHLSPGPKGPTFDAVRSAMIAKYNRSLRPQMVTTTTTTVFLGRQVVLSAVLNSFVVLGIARRLGRFAAGLRPGAIHDFHDG
jgi:hypothetical protein